MRSLLSNLLLKVLTLDGNIKHPLDNQEVVYYIHKLISSALPKHIYSKTNKIPRTLFGTCEEIILKILHRPKGRMSGLMPKMFHSKKRKLITPSLNYKYMNILTIASTNVPIICPIASEIKTTRIRVVKNIKNLHNSNG